MLNNVEATGYYTWNPETNTYVKQLVIRQDALDDRNPTNYIYLVDGEYYQFNFENEKFEFLNTVTAKQLPSKEELYAKMLGSINSPASGIANSVNAVLSQLTRAMAAVRDQKSA